MPPATDDEEVVPATTEPAAIETSDDSSDPADEDESGSPGVVGIVGENTIDEFEAGFAEWSAESVLEASPLPVRQQHSFDGADITFYFVDAANFVAVKEDDDGLILGHAVYFDPSGPSYLGFWSVYLLTILPADALAGPEIQQFINDGETEEFARSYDAGDVVIRRTGVDPVDAPIFAMTVIANSEPAISHEDLLADAASAGWLAGSDLTGGEAAGTAKRDLTVDVCEFVNGEAHFMFTIVNNGTEVREYLLRLEVVDDEGDRQIVSTYATDVEPGETWEFEETDDLGGANWELCEIVLINEGP